MSKHRSTSMTVVLFISCADLICFCLTIDDCMFSDIAHAHHKIQYHEL